MQLKYPALLPLASNSLVNSSTPLTVYNPVKLISARNIFRLVLLTAVDYTHVHAKRFTGEIRHIAHIITKITQWDDPVEDCSPDARPCHEAGVNRMLVLYNDIIDGIIEQRYQTGYTDNSQRLRSENTENDSSERGWEQCFVNAEEPSCATVHIEGISDGWEDAGVGKWVFHALRRRTEPIVMVRKVTYFTKYIRTVLAIVR